MSLVFSDTEYVNLNSANRPKCIKILLIAILIINILVVFGFIGQITIFLSEKDGLNKRMNHYGNFFTEAKCVMGYLAKALNISC